MSPPPRFAPPTQLDVLRALLSGFSEGDRTFTAQLHKSLLSLRQLALPELGQRLARSTTPMGLRKRILEATTTCDWPEWSPHLVSALQHEDDLAFFNDGCMALGGLCIRSAMEGLLRLKKLRLDADRQSILDRELGEYQPEASFEACLDALMVGQSGPAQARRGARWLAALAGPEHLDALLDAFRLGDPLTCHLLLRLLAGIQTPAVDDLLINLLEDTRLECLDCQPLGQFATALDALHGKARRELLIAKCEACFTACPPALLQALRDLLLGSSRPPAPSLDPLRAQDRGPLRGFLLKALTLLVQDKPLGFDALLRETLASRAYLEAAYATRLDEIAGLLAAKVDQKQLPLEQALPLLEAAFQASAGGDGLGVAYLRLIPCQDQERLERILAEPQLHRRMRCLEVLGAREDDGLAGFFLKAMNDPVKEVGQLAIHQLGKLPSGLPGMMDLFRSEETSRVREAIRFFTENRSKAAVKALMSFLSSESSDDLLVDAVNALGIIRDPGAMNALLRQLHAGKPLALQVAIIEALSQFGEPAAALGVLKKSEELTLPEVLLLALRGALSAFPSFEQPFPPDQVLALERLVERCCDPREGAGRWLHAAQVVQDLFVFDAAAYDRLGERFTALLVDVHQQPFWVRKGHDQIAEVLKKLSRRAASLSTLEEREKLLQSSIESIPDAGPKRMQALFRLKEILSDPEHALSEGCTQALVAFLEKELLREDLDSSESEFLCRITGLSGQSRMLEPLADLHAHTRSPEVQAAARKALRVLGLSEQEILSRKPIRSILVLEPNAFFRNRLVSFLEGSERSVEVAAGRQEAQVILAEQRVDLLISESHDALGDLWPWFTAQWQQRRLRYLLLSTSSHEPGFLAECPWVIGRLYKPYPSEDLVKAIED